MYKTDTRGKRTLSGYTKALCAALALSGIGLFFCGGKTETVRVPSNNLPAASAMVRHGAPSASRQHRRELMRSLESLKKKMETADLIRANNRGTARPAMSIQDEFPYHSLDCSMVPLDRSPSLSNTNPETFFSSIPTHLDEEINRLKAYRDAEGLRSMISYLSSLNIEWGKGDSENLFGLYSSMETDARVNGWDKAPDPRCISRILCAMKTLFRAEEVLGDMLARNPREAEIVLNNLPETQRERVILSSAIGLLYSEKFDAPSTQELFASLSPQNMDMFIRVLNSFLVNDHETIARLNRVALSVSNPRLRMALALIVERWMRQIIEWEQNGVLSSESQSVPEACEEEGSPDECS